mmetsp:Transcript_11620/g.23549  ORF Transcript_11620/g.23549 Transcript_11620/m.23549 type:complete len:260 (-) Transcript_11620:311-1090(-)
MGAADGMEVRRGGGEERRHAREHGRLRLRASRPHDLLGGQGLAEGGRVDAAVRGLRRRRWRSHAHRHHQHNVRGDRRRQELAPGHCDIRPGGREEEVAAGRRELTPHSEVGQEVRARHRGFEPLAQLALDHVPGLLQPRGSLLPAPLHGADQHQSRAPHGRLRGVWRPRVPRTDGRLAQRTALIVWARAHLHGRRWCDGRGAPRRSALFDFGHPQASRHHEPAVAATGAQAHVRRIQVHWQDDRGRACHLPQWKDDREG